MKRIRMALLLIMLCLTAFFIQTAGRKTQIKVYEDGIYIQTSAGQGEKVISAYRDDSDGDGIYYFFLPAFVEGNQIETETDRVSVYQGGRTNRQKRSFQMVGRSHIYVKSEGNG